MFCKIKAAGALFACRALAICEIVVYSALIVLLLALVKLFGVRDD